MPLQRPTGHGLCLCPAHRCTCLRHSVQANATESANVPLGHAETVVGKSLDLPAECISIAGGTTCLSASDANVPAGQGRQIWRILLQNTPQHAVHLDMRKRPGPAVKDIHKAEHHRSFPSRRCASRWASVALCPNHCEILEKAHCTRFAESLSLKDPRGHVMAQHSEP